jgi:hypothetical protein
MQAFGDRRQRRKKLARRAVKAGRALPENGRLGVTFRPALEVTVRMETLKGIDEIQKPDERNLYWGSVATGEPVTIEDRYAEIASIHVNPTAPEDVRSYFVTIQNVCVYAWFSYDFYALVVFLTFTLIEMALKLRFPMKGRDRRTLHDVLQKAIKQKLINEKAFTHIKVIRQQRAENLRELRRLKYVTRSNLPKNDYLAILLKSLPKLRNSFAHPSGHAIHFPHEAIFSLRFAAEFVNQLFPMP